MNNLYEQFSCKTKEELYEKVQNEDSQVKPLLDFIEFAKADIKNKNTAITTPETFIDYVKSLTMPTKDSGTIIFVDNKNHPVLLKRTRLSRKNEIKETLKAGLISGGTRTFIAFSEETHTSRISQLQSFFEDIGIQTIDSLSYNKDYDTLRSTSVGRSFCISSSYEIINDGDNEYLKDDFSLKEGYTDFSSYFAKNEIIGLKMIDDIDKVKEKLKIGFQHHHQEVCGIIAYDNDEKIISTEELFKGGTDSSIVDLKIVAKRLLKLKDLKGISIFHNHPSGNPIPSKEDISMTEKLARMCEALGVEFLDHFIVGKEKVLSFAENIDKFQSKNLRYQDKISNITSVNEKSIDYDNDKEMLVENRKNYEEIKDAINNIINSNYKDFVKSIISIEKGVEDEATLDEMYNRFMDNDGINLINDYFDDVQYDLEHENIVGEVIDKKIAVDKPIVKEKVGKLERASLLNELKVNAKMLNKDKNKNKKELKNDAVEL